MNTIKTVYHREGRAPKVNRAKDANRAVATCILHMQVNHYGSAVAEVYDEATGELHAIVTYTVEGLNIVYRRDPRKHETKYALAFLLDI